MFGSEAEFKHDAIYAHALLKEPKRIDIIEGKYVIIIASEEQDRSPLDVLNRTINLMATKGWKCNNLSSYKGWLIALMEKV